MYCFMNCVLATEKNCNGIQRGIGGEKKNKGDKVKGHLLLMKY